MTDFDKTVQLMQLQTQSPSDFRKSKLGWTIAQDWEFTDDTLYDTLDRVATGRLFWGGPSAVLALFRDKSIELTFVDCETETPRTKSVTYYLRAPRNFDKMNARLAPLGRELGRMLDGELADLENEDV